MIDHHRLLELLHYDPVTGIFTRKIALGNNTKVGDVAGNFCKGYIELSVDGRVYRAHILAWFYVYGKWPTKLLDHKDLNKSHNAISNLREANQSQNGANTKLSSRNSIGYKGVAKHGTKFKASLMINRKRQHLGVFNTPEDAAYAYDLGAVKNFGQFALTNQQMGLLP